MELLNTILNYKIFEIGEYSFNFSIIISVALIIFFTKLFLWGVKKILFRAKNVGKLEGGNLHSLLQIITYLIWIISILIILDTIGLELNVILAGSAALLVGVGLGLQNTFNDFISGIILLFEGTVKVGNILEIEGEVIKIEEIGLRTSEAITRDDITVLIPNSMITTSKVINWSHQSEKTRFNIKVGVAYGSDVELVLKLLRESAMEASELIDDDTVNARFANFGNSSLDFEVLFYSESIFRIETLKSDVRQLINKKFMENNITIPFPQLDLHIKSDDRK